MEGLHDSNLNFDSRVGLESETSFKASCRLFHQFAIFSLVPFSNLSKLLWTGMDDSNLNLFPSEFPPKLGSECFLFPENSFFDSIVITYTGANCSRDLTQLKTSTTAGQYTTDSEILTGHSIQSWESSTVKDHKCQVCCKSFTTPQDLNYHLVIHTVTGKRNFLCHNCGKSYQSKIYLATHRRIHTWEKPYFCENLKCEKNLKLQMTGWVKVCKIDHICQLCGRTSLFKASLEKHINQKHQGGSVDIGSGITTKVDLVLIILSMAWVYRLQLRSTFWTRWSWSMAGTSWQEDRRWSRLSPRRNWTGWSRLSPTGNCLRRKYWEWRNFFILRRSCWQFWRGIWRCKIKLGDKWLIISSI